MATEEQRDICRMCGREAMVKDGCPAIGNGSPESQLECMLFGYTREHERAEGLTKELEAAKEDLDVAREGHIDSMEAEHVKVDRANSRADAATARVAELEKQLAVTEEDRVDAVADSINEEKRADKAEAELARLRALPDGIREATHRCGICGATFRRVRTTSWFERVVPPHLQEGGHDCHSDLEPIGGPLPSAQQIPAPAQPPNADTESLFSFHEAALPLAQAATEYRADFCSDQPHAVIQKSLDKMAKVARRSSRLADFFINDRNAKAAQQIPGAPLNAKMDKP